MSPIITTSIKKLKNQRLRNKQTIAVIISNKSIPMVIFVKGLIILASL